MHKTTPGGNLGADQVRIPACAETGERFFRDGDEEDRGGVGEVVWLGGGDTYGQDRYSIRYEVHFSDTIATFCRFCLFTSLS